MLDRAVVRKTKVKKIRIYQMVLTFDKAQATTCRVRHEARRNIVKS